MGIVIEFPASAGRREAEDLVLDETITATVIILPVIRIERHVEPIGTGPEETAAPGRRRRRRARS